LYKIYFIQFIPLVAPGKIVNKKHILIRRELKMTGKIHRKTYRASF